jgi:hypothetical protein
VRWSAAVAGSVQASWRLSDWPALTRCRARQGEGWCVSFGGEARGDERRNHQGGARRLADRNKGERGEEWG